MLRLIECCVVWMFFLIHFAVSFLCCKAPPFLSPRPLLTQSTNAINTTDVPFPKSFLSRVKTIFKRLFRVYAHIYYNHFQRVVSLGEEAHLNTCFKVGSSVRWGAKGEGLVGRMVLRMVLWAAVVTLIWVVVDFFIVGIVDVVLSVVLVGCSTPVCFSP